MASRTLYPPLIDSYMPAFKAGNNPCRIYFRLSKFNGSGDFKNLHVSIVKQNTGMNVIKTTDDNNRYRATGIIINVAYTKVEDEDNLYYIDIPDSDLSSTSGSYSGWIPGWIYKVQLRLSNAVYDGSIGQAAWLNGNASNFSEWSTICIVKATGRIDYQIPILDIDTTNENENQEVETQEYQSTTLDISGSFIREVDSSELIHSYRFTLYDINDEIIETSGDIYANEYQDSDSFRYLFKTELRNGETYKLAFKFETINKYVDGFYKFDDEQDDRYEFICTYYGTDIPPCFIVTAENDVPGIFINHPDHYHIDSDENNSPTFAEDNINSNSNNSIISSSIYQEEEEGRVALKLYSSSSEVWSGNLCIRRTSSRTNFKVWDDILIYVCKQENINDIPIIYDYTIESGVWYKYGVQTIDTLGDRGELLVTNTPVLRNFNYSFLLGKNNQQLKLKFDNSMDSFKYQIYDSKIDPIGSKYPAITRNANTYYKTFPLNGLISFNMDDSELFCNKKVIYEYEDIKNLYDDYNKDNNITQYDYIYERDFRNKVLEFLQDGEFKLFKSPTEGNMIIRITDINCTPNNTLGRLVYSFSATAHEMAEPIMENYLKYGFYTVGKYGTSFEIYETKIGQITMDVPVGSNIFDLIKQKYDTRGQNIGGYTRKLTNIHHIKITFDDKPLRVQNSSGELVMGNNILLENKLITVYSPIRMYEIDNRKIYNIDSSELVILGNASDEVAVTTVHVTVDFLYESIVDTYIGKQILTKKNKKSFGQFFKECLPGENIFREIYYKYYVEWPYDFSRLYALSSIDIEANPYAVFAISEDAVNTIADNHVVGITGRLQFYEMNNIKEIKYLGIKNPTTGEIEAKKTDVLINYLYIVQEGTYKKEK